MKLNPKPQADEDIDYDGMDLDLERIAYDLHSAMNGKAIVLVGRRNCGADLIMDEIISTYGWLGPESLYRDPDPQDCKDFAARVTGHTILFTSNPLIVNEFPAEQIVIVTRVLGRIHACRMIDTRNYEERAAVYAPGELWLAYFGTDW